MNAQKTPHPPHSKLPNPTPEAIAHSNELVKILKSTAENAVGFSFSQYMEKVLYSPQYGYYSGGLPKIGPEGDFITAPEISPLFSHCLAQQSTQVLNQLNQPNIIEFGAGKGTMAKDILQALQHSETPLNAYYIIELSADLRQIQQQTLSALPDAWFNKIHWLDQLPKDPISAVVLANEVLDAMPVERLRFMPEQNQQAQVRFNQQSNRFEWDYHPIQDPVLAKQAEALRQLTGQPSSEGYTTEVNNHIAPWLESIHDFLSEGAVFLIDYGYSQVEYYQPARVMGTLRCHFQHLAHDDPFFFPGLQDITAHVDFTAVADAGFEAGFNIAGFTTQAHFLMGSGLLEMSADPTLNITDTLKVAQQIKTLTLPDEMGETFKVMALTKQLDIPLMGFQIRDLRHIL